MENELLKTLGKDKLEELISRYYSEEKVSDLIEEFELDVKVSGLLKLFPLKELDNDRCPYCNKAMQQRYVSKSVSKYQLPNPFCIECGHSDNESCFCSQCRIIEEEKNFNARLNYQKKIKNILHSYRDITQLTDLSLIQAISLVGLCRLGREEDSDLIGPIKYHEKLLAPSELMSLDIVKSLYDNQLIDVSLTTPSNSIYFDLTDQTADFNWNSIQWRLNLSNNSDENINLIESLESTLKKSELWPDSWESELDEIWKELALHQCLKYLQVHVEDHGFEFRAGKKTRQVLRDLLNEYSILKSYYFIWVSAHNAASYYLRKNTSRRQAANIIIGNIQSRSEKALAEKWDIKEYSKDSRCGESVLTALFSNVVTDLGDDFFKRKPDGVNASHIHIKVTD